MTEPGRGDAPSDASASAAAELPDRIAFVGLGLIGGSVVMALRNAGYRGRITAWTPAGRGPVAASARGLVDDAAPSLPAALDGAGLVVLAAPPLDVVGLATALGGPLATALPGDATVTDVASTKAAVVAAADAAGIRFVGGHPMAGRERSGVAAASPDLFRDRPWVIVPGVAARPVDVDRTEALALAAGARPVRLDAATHDEAVAAISHLPLVLAASLATSVAGSGAGEPPASWAIARMLAATGWSDMTRLARGDPAMGAGILASNADAVAARLVALRAEIDAWLDRLALETPDADELREALHRARAALEAPE